jgi:hypothetical protein
MKYPVFFPNQYVDQNLLNNSIGVVMDSIYDIAAAAQSTAGLLNASSLAFTTNNSLTVSLSAPKPFYIVFPNGTIVSANGTTDGASSSTYSLDFTSYVPASGSQTVYIIASSTTIGQSSTLIYGPPLGDPNYSISYTPQYQYLTTQYSLSISPSLTAPDNSTTFELGRVTLSAGQTAITSIDTSHQVNGNFGVTYTAVVDALGFTPLSDSIFGDNNTWTGSNTFSQSVSSAGFEINGNSVVTSFSGRYGNVNPEASDYSSFYGQLGSANIWTANNVLQSTQSGSASASPSLELQGWSGSNANLWALYTGVSGNLDFAFNSSVLATISTTGTLTAQGLAINGGSSFEGVTFNSNSTNSYYALFNTSVNSQFGFHFLPSSGSTYPDEITWDRDNEAGYAFAVYNATTATYCMNVTDSGNLTTTGTITSGSSRVLKKNISPLGCPHCVANKLLSLVPVDFQYIKDDKKSMGFIAEDVQKVFPELVTPMNDDILGLNYDGLIAPIVSCLQYLNKKVKTLEDQLRVFQEREGKLA